MRLGDEDEDFLVLGVCAWLIPDMHCTWAVSLFLFLPCSFLSSSFTMAIALYGLDPTLYSPSVQVFWISVVDRARAITTSGTDNSCDSDHHPPTRRVKRESSGSR